MGVFSYGKGLVVAEGFRPLVDLALCFLASPSVALLNLADQLVAFASDLFDFIIGEIAPTGTNITAKLFPLACNLIPEATTLIIVHCCLLHITSDVFTLPRLRAVCIHRLKVLNLGRIARENGTVDA